MTKLNILAFSGSLRAHSYNTGLIRAAAQLAGDQMQITLVDISSFPLYNQDMESHFPAELTQLKQQIREADGILFATPEFNRSIPGGLKNMLDWTSRPYGDNPWAGKPVATMGAGGLVGTALAQYHLKQILLYLDARIMGQPEFYVSGTKEKFDEQGNLTDEKTTEKIVKLLTHLRTFIES
jgi:chromate reductase, NAD(P)H dehydrogenase (quinone)